MWLAIFGVGSLLLGWFIGWALSINANVQRQVDMRLRAETRHRHPTATDSSADESMARAQARAAHARSVFMPERVAGGTKWGLTTAEATSGVEELSEAVRHQQRYAAVDRPIYGWDIAGIDKYTHKLTPCLRDPGHDGECR